MNGADSRSQQARDYRLWYRTARWQRIRSHQIATDPLCAMCMERGKLSPASICDHVDPKSKATEARFFAGPFQSLCKPCHDRHKQKIEATGYDGAVDASGWPTDPRHPANAKRR